MIMSKRDDKIGGIGFWDSVSSTFKENDHVFYELYNEPHVDDNQIHMYVHGNDDYEGMLELEAAVRANVPSAVVIIGGAK